MAYKGEDAVYNLRTAVEAAYDRFRDLAFDADHEAVYGMGMFPIELCQQRSARYSEAANICYDYLNSKLCKRCLVRLLDVMDFEFFTDSIKKFLHQNDEKTCNLCQ